MCINPFARGVAYCTQTYEYPKMYYSPELQKATQTMIDAARKNKKILGLFLFGTERVAEFIKKGFVFISIGNDLHHILTQAQTHMATLKDTAKKEGKVWSPRPSAFL